MIRIKKFVCLTLFFVLLSSCNAFAQEKTAVAVTKPLMRLAVLPFHAVWPEENSTTARCPICGSVNSSGSIARGAEKILEELFTDKLRELKNTEVIVPEKAAGIYKRVAADSLKKPALQIIRKTGSELGADVLAVGYLYHYRERVGYDYSVERPASVAFEIHLISVKDGGTLWRGIFDKTQKSLMEDVFQASSFFKGGAKWLTARELTKLGIDEIFATFPSFEP